ncbi:MAG: hypothetical protein Q8L50_15070, partial [Polaromonas sp.]|nr:hypothetical protein [Polaromonas sp.]
MTSNGRVIDPSSRDVYTHHHHQEKFMFSGQNTIRPSIRLTGWFLASALGLLAAPLAALAQASANAMATQ